MREYRIVSIDELVKIMDKGKLIDCGMSGIFPKLHWYITTNNFYSEIKDIYCDC